jgi:quinol-cytochrome oxidoreductase complex cytochrome b subunit
MGFMVTGELLPWDQNGYLTTQAFVALLKGVPVVGSTLLSLWAGGVTLGAAALTRFYAAHNMLLPAALTGLLFLHFLMVRKQGISRPL